MTGLGKGYIETAEIARVLGPKWSARRVRRWLQRRGAATKIGGRWYTTRAKLRSAFPEVYEELLVGGF